MHASCHVSLCSALICHVFYLLRVSILVKRYIFLFISRLSGLLVERTEWEGKIDELRKTVQKLDEEKTYQQEVVCILM